MSNFNSSYFSRELFNKVIFISFIFSLIFFSLSFIEEKIKIKNEVVVVNLLKGLVNNPVVFLQNSFYYEKKLDYGKAVREINLAIGILINNSTSNNIVRFYLFKANVYCEYLNFDNDDCRLVLFYNSIIDFQ